MRGIMISKLISEQQATPPAPPPTPPSTGAAPVATAAPPAPETTPDITPVETLVQKDFNAFKTELKGIEDQKGAVLRKWENAIKKKVSGKKVKILASKAQHFQPPSEYTIDVSDVKIEWHYDKTTGEIVYDLILMDRDKKYFTKPRSQVAPETPDDSQEPETAEAPKVPEPELPSPPESQEDPEAEKPQQPPLEKGLEMPSEPSAPESPQEPDAKPVPPVPPPGDVPDPEDEKEKRRKAALGELALAQVDESSILNNESYAVSEIMGDIKNVIEEITGRTSMKPYLLGAGRKSKNKIQFEINIPKNHIREGLEDSDIELSFKVNDMIARVTEDYKGTYYKVRVEKYE